MARMVMRGVLAVLFAGAGLAHLIAPHELLKITPDWVPFAPAVILVTGLGELACAAALLTQSLRSGLASRWPYIRFAFGQPISNTRSKGFR
jgi:uncharacterized membrane protein